MSNRAETLSLIAVEFTIFCNPLRREKPALYTQYFLPPYKMVEYYHRRVKYNCRSSRTLTKNPLQNQRKIATKTRPGKSRITLLQGLSHLMSREAVSLLRWPASGFVKVLHILVLQIS
ncbi:hypothetical protein HWI79_2535 [Cryptosporidium felis]|nr:hypothetical protein HWI79_2535 [Cryptosporidium felis]